MWDVSTLLQLWSNKQLLYGLLSLLVISGGTVAISSVDDERVIYQDPDNHNNTLTLVGSGVIGDGSKYSWHQTNQDRSGEWHTENGKIYLNVNELFLNDVKLTIHENTVIWSNGAYWVKV